MHWMIRDQDGVLYWSEVNEGGWVEAPDATVLTDDEKARIAVPTGAKWIELWDCDSCGELMPHDTGEGRTTPFTRQSIDPPETTWICEVCLGNREAAEETRAETLREQYYELK